MDCQLVFQSHCLILHFYQYIYQGSGFSLPFSCLTVVHLFDESHHTLDEVIAHPGFNVQIHSDFTMNIHTLHSLVWSLVHRMAFCPTPPTGNSLLPMQSFQFILNFFLGRIGEGFKDNFQCDITLKSPNFFKIISLVFCHAML